MKAIKFGLALLLCSCTGNISSGPAPGVTGDSGTKPDSGSLMDSGIKLDSGPLKDSSLSGEGGFCGEVEVKSAPVVPNVIVIVDQSGSMNEPFGASSRWQTLKDYMLGGSGLIETYQSRVNFGLALYTGKGPSGESCPYLSQVPARLGNFAAITAAYGPAEPFNDTPTGDAVNAVVASLEPSTNPTVFILATDGEPDTCEVPNPQEGQQEAIDAVKYAYNLGIVTHIVAVANESELSQGHVNDMANAGQGVTSGAVSYRVNTGAEVASALTQIVSGSISCTVAIEGVVTISNPCLGTVKLNGNDLTCGSDNGWNLQGNSVVLTGAACDSYKLGGEIKAYFPCDTVILL